MLPTLATQHLPHPASATAPPTPKDQTLNTRNPSLNCLCFLFLSTSLPPTYIRTYDEHCTSAINTACSLLTAERKRPSRHLSKLFFNRQKEKKNANMAMGHGAGG